MKEQHQRFALVTGRDIMKLNAIGFHILMIPKGLVLQDLWWSCTDRNTALSAVRQMMGMQINKVQIQELTVQAI